MPATQDRWDLCIILLGLMESIVAVLLSFITMGFHITLRHVPFFYIKTKQPEKHQDVREITHQL